MRGDPHLFVAAKQALAFVSLPSPAQNVTA